MRRIILTSSERWKFQKLQRHYWYHLNKLMKNSDFTRLWFSSLGYGDLGYNFQTLANTSDEGYTCTPHEPSTAKDFSYLTSHNIRNINRKRSIERIRWSMRTVHALNLNTAHIINRGAVLQQTETKIPTELILAATHGPFPPSGVWMMLTSSSVSRTWTLFPHLSRVGKNPENQNRRNISMTWWRWQQQSAAERLWSRAKLTTFFQPCYTKVCESPLEPHLVQLANIADFDEAVDGRVDGRSCVRHRLQVCLDLIDPNRGDA